MVRDRRDIARKDGAAKAAAASASPGPSASAPSADTTDKALAGNRQPAPHHDQLLALIRALARDAARADRAAERGAPDD
ncbi:hypothetical protein [Paracoccus versutus]|uniref:hypothetical protein n=1 Tax=Paracoccus versutus TaxID=34007 RepID=UPI00112DBFB2|nr:hypothetical protein [Paracoccus versutus]WGR54887.1 hypothetical protein E3U25_02120 [Paracoccus versutus]